MRVLVITALAALVLVAPASAGMGTPVSPKQVEQTLGVNNATLGIGTLSTTDVTCWFKALNHTWGITPVQQVLGDRTYWCAHYNGNITYRSTNVGQSSDLCSLNGTDQYKIAGGTSTYYVDWVDDGYYTCPLPYIGYHIHDWMTLTITSYGYYKMYQHN